MEKTYWASEFIGESSSYSGMSGRLVLGAPGSAGHSAWCSGTAGGQDWLEYGFEKALIAAKMILVPCGGYLLPVRVSGRGADNTLVELWAGKLNPANGQQTVELKQTGKYMRAFRLDFDNSGQWSELNGFAIVGLDDPEGSFDVKMWSSEAIGQSSNCGGSYDVKAVLGFPEVAKAGLTYWCSKAGGGQEWIELAIPSSGIPTSLEVVPQAYTGPSKIYGKDADGQLHELWSGAAITARTVVKAALQKLAFRHFRLEFNVANGSYGALKAFAVIVAFDGVSSLRRLAPQVALERAKVLLDQTTKIHVDFKAVQAEMHRAADATCAAAKQAADNACMAAKTKADNELVPTITSCERSCAAVEVFMREATESLAWLQNLTAKSYADFTPDDIMALLRYAGIEFDPNVFQANNVNAELFCLCVGEDDAQAMLGIRAAGDCARAARLARSMSTGSGPIKGLDISKDGITEDPITWSRSQLVSWADTTPLEPIKALLMEHRFAGDILTEMNLDLIPLILKLDLKQKLAFKKAFFELRSKIIGQNFVKNV